MLWRRLTPLVLGVWLAGCGASVLPSVHSETERLALARRMRDQGKYDQAIELLKTYVDNNAGSADVDDALYMLGDSYLRTKAWTDAGAQFERLLRDYPESDSSGSARFRLGEALFAQSRPVDFDQDYTLRAIEEWQRYLRDFPGHWLNAEATNRINQGRTRLADKLVRTGSLYLKLRLPEPARLYFSRVTSEYGDTAKVSEAELGLALADALDGKRTEAIAQLKSIEERYPGQPVAEKAARERRRLEKRT